VTTGERIYLDNAATSFPKPEATHEAMSDFARRLGASAGRGAYAEARETGELMNTARERLAQLLGVPDPKQIVWTSNCTDGLNLAIRGVLEPGDHVITSAMDHNSVLRPLNELSKRMPLEVTRLECSAEGLLDPDEVGRAIQPNTKLVAIVHASNVTGSMMPIAEIGRVAREHDVLFLTDIAQSAGHVPMNLGELPVDLAAFPGHKGLLGTLGTGGLYIRPGLEGRLATLKEGGTGTISEQDVQPDFLPDKYEPGSHNALGIIALGAGVGYLLERGIDRLRQHDVDLTQRFIDGLDAIEGVDVYGTRNIDDRVGVVSINIAPYHCRDVADLLDERYGVLVRAGLHCAPWAHQTIGTYPTGTARFSFGAFNTARDVDTVLDSLRDIVATRPAVKAGSIGR